MCTTSLENIMIFDPARVVNETYNDALRNVTKALNAGINHDDTCRAVNRTADAGHSHDRLQPSHHTDLGPLCQARGRQYVVELVPGRSGHLTRK